MWVVVLACVSMADQVDRLDLCQSAPPNLWLLAGVRILACRQTYLGNCDDRVGLGTTNGWRVFYCFCWPATGQMRDEDEAEPGFRRSVVQTRLDRLVVKKNDRIVWNTPNIARKGADVKGKH